MVAREAAEFLVVSVPDREGLVGEIWFQDEQWAILYQEQDELVLKLYPRVSGEEWTLRYQDAIELLGELRSRLLDEPPART